MNTIRATATIAAATALTAALLVALHETTHATVALLSGGHLQACPSTGIPVAPTTVGHSPGLMVCNAGGTAGAWNNLAAMTITATVSLATVAAVTPARTPAAVGVLVGGLAAAVNDVGYLAGVYAGGDGLVVARELPGARVVALAGLVVMAGVVAWRVRGSGGWVVPAGEFGSEDSVQGEELA